MASSHLLDRLPEAIIKYIKNIFRDTNKRITAILSNQPNLYEVTLDQMFVTNLKELGGSAKIIDSQGAWIVTLEAMFMGGFPVYETYEVADIAVWIFFRYKGKVIKTKTGLLQSKRLYAKESKMDVNSPLYQKLVNPVDNIWKKPQRFHFDEDSRYLSLTMDHQIEAIEKFLDRFHTPVYYLLYNPWNLPTEVEVPSTSSLRYIGIPTIGIRVCPAEPVIDVVREKKGFVTYRDIKDVLSNINSDEIELTEKIGGWRIEDWLADLLLQCKEGHTGYSLEDSHVETWMHTRVRPIVIGFSIVIDMPESI